MIVATVPQEKFQAWNDKFVRLVGELSDSVEAVVMSEKTIEMVQEIYQLLRNFDSTDINERSRGYYYLLMQLRTVLLNVDMESLFAQLNEAQFLLEESVWKLSTGQWPEMQAFLVNFLRNTAGSEQFWRRLGKTHHCPVFIF